MSDSDLDALLRKLEHRREDLSAGYWNREIQPIVVRLTERLQRPSRYEFAQKLLDFRETSLGDRAQSLCDELIDLACGPEPKPRGKRTVGEVYDPCAFGEHEDCFAIMVFSASTHAGSYCTCECHTNKEEASGVSE